MESVKVLDVTGNAEVYSAPNSQWLPLRKDTRLKEGSRVRTGAGSEVQIAFDDDLESVAKIGQNSRLQFLKSGSFQAVLEQGSFFLFSDKAEANPSGFFKVRTKEAQIRLSAGGCQIAYLKEGVLVRVFADSVVLSKKMPKKTGPRALTVPEGFKCMISPTGSKFSLRRMGYRDYADWQAWIQKIYEIKDDAMDEFWNKGMAA